MDKIKKALRTLSPRERRVVTELVAAIVAGDFSGLDIKKLKGHKDIFRVRKGDIRIVFMMTDAGSRLISIDRRKEDTYSL